MNFKCAGQLTILKPQYADFGAMLMRRRISFIIAIFFLGASAAAAQSSKAVSFGSAITFPTPVTGPTSIAVGDINNDGIPDIGVVSDKAPTVSYALGKGDGTFGSWGSTPAGPAPISLTLGDINQDGNVDALASDSQTNYVYVSWGDGRGNFTQGPALTGGLGSTPLQTFVADLNGDGIPDIVGSELCYGGGQQFPGHVFVLLGKGKGVFKPVKNFFTGGACPAGLAVGDFNNDGIPDVVVADTVECCFGTKGAGVAVLLGRGDGTFQRPRRYPSGPYPMDVAIGDFDGDGNLDVAESFSGAYSIHLFDGIGDGTLAAGTPYPSGLGAGWLAVADFNGDGKPDLAVADSGFVAVLLGNGDGTFSAPAKFAVGPFPLQLVVADFNGDGRPDIAAVDNSASTVSILLNTTK